MNACFAAQTGFKVFSFTSIAAMHCLYHFPDLYKPFMDWAELFIHTERIDFIKTVEFKLYQI